LVNYKSFEMFKTIKMNHECLKNETNDYQCFDDFYGILLKTGAYINAKDNIYQIIGSLFYIKRLFNR